jgi:hypothetical protein
MEWTCILAFTWGDQNCFRTPTVCRKPSKYTEGLLLSMIGVCTKNENSSNVIMNKMIN